MEGGPGPFLRYRVPEWLFPKPCVFLVHQAVVQLPKEGLGPKQRLAWRKLTRRPNPHGAAVVIGQSLVAAGLFLVLDHLLGAKELFAVTQVLMKALRTVRQDGRQQPDQRAQQRVDDGLAGAR